MGIYAVAWIVVLLWAAVVLETVTRGARGTGSQALIWSLLFLVTAFVGGILGGLIGSGW